MHAKTRAAFRARPLVCLLENKILYSNGFDAFQIGDNAYSVLCPVATVKVPQFGTGKIGASKTELMVAGGKLHAILDCTGETRI